jgi:hypothetical protein
MKVRFRRLLLLGLSVAFVVSRSTSLVLAQSSDEEIPRALSGGLLFFALVCGLVFYVYLALALQTIATKTGTPNAWLAWIPIGNIILMLNVAKKPLWWFLLFLIPLVNLVMAIIVWMGVPKLVVSPTGGAFL